MERADVVAVLEGMRRERVAECGGLARLGRHPCQTAACLSARRRTVSCRWWRWHCPVTQSRWVPGRLDSPSTAYTADRGRAMSTYSLSCGRGPTIACGGRSGKERPRLYGRRDTGLGRRPGGAAPHGRAKLSRGPWVPPVGATKALSGELWLRPLPRSGSRVTCLPASGCGPLQPPKPRGRLPSWARGPRRRHAVSPGLSCLRLRSVSISRRGPGVPPLSPPGGTLK